MTDQHESEEDQQKKPGGLRSLSIETGVAEFCDGSARVEAGKTIVRCGARIQHYVPGWKQEEGGGWVTAEYSMIPSSSPSRQRRDRFGYHDKRSLEIERIISRSLRAAVDLELVGERTLQVDCDVIQAAGGTRTASITGGWVALGEAFQKMTDENMVVKNPLTSSLGAVSVGLVNGETVVDLDHSQDGEAEMDLNIAMTSDGRLAEIQGTAEADPVPRERVDEMVEAAKPAISAIIRVQEQALKKGRASLD